MTLQTRGFGWSVTIHGLILIAFVFLQFAAGAQTRVAIIDFTLGNNRPEAVVPPTPQQKIEEPHQKTERPVPRPKEDKEEQAVAQVEPTIPNPLPLSMNGKEVPAMISQAEKLLEPAAGAVLRKDGPVGPEQNPKEMAFSDKGRSAEMEREKAIYLKEHFSYIRDRITKSITYPHMARKMGWCGQVKIAFVICEDGRVNEVNVVDSSGFSMLDRNAVDTVINVAPFPLPPVRAEIRMAITYRLN
jgi:protein TonB